MRKKVLNIIMDNWPVSVSEVARKLGLMDHKSHPKIKQAAISRVAYHFKQLEKLEKIKTKRIGKATIAWPIDIEKLRMVYELIKVD